MMELALLLAVILLGATLLVTILVYERQAAVLEADLDYALSMREDESIAWTRS